MFSFSFFIQRITYPTGRTVIEYETINFIKSDRYSTAILKNTLNLELSYDTVKIIGIFTQCTRHPVYVFHGT